MVTQEKGSVKPQPLAQNDGIREKKSDNFEMLSSAVERERRRGGICDEKFS